MGSWNDFGKLGLMNDRLDPEDLIMQRLTQWVYERPVIGNVERGVYVECMVELALQEHDPAWHLTEPWTGWDVEHRRTRARIEIKQSAALQRWHARGMQGVGDKTGRLAESRPGAPPNPRFSIKPHEGYYSDDGTWIAIEPQRHADLYVFAYHQEEDPNVADQRCPDQWQFFVVAEPSLPQDKPLAKSIGLARLAAPGAERGDYATLATMVANALTSLQTLKADQVRR